MPDRFDRIVQRAISPRTVQPNGPLTMPRSYGVYKLPEHARGTRQHRYGNHPVRMAELEREFGSCHLEFLFLSRNDARAVALALNDRGA